MPLPVGQTLNGMKPSMMSIDYISDDKVPGLSSIKALFGCSIENKILKRLYLPFMVILIVPILQGAIFVVHKLVEKKKDFWYNKVISKLYSIFGMRLYLTIFMPIYTVLMFASFPEIHAWINHEKGDLFSRIISCPIMAL